ncbi:MAG: malectin domain-containing carbohydrate-binding protein, partial [bacterium]
PTPTSTDSPSPSRTPSPTHSPTATITPTKIPTPDACQDVVAVDCGSTSAYTSAVSGLTFGADQQYVAGSAPGAAGSYGYVTAGTTLATTATFTGDSADAALFNTQEYASTLTYDFSVPDGPAYVTLYWAETYATAVGQRAFNVSINGTQVESALDLYATAGADATVIKTFPVTVTNGVISVVLTATVNNALIQGISVQAGNPCTPSPTRSPTWTESKTFTRTASPSPSQTSTETPTATPSRSGTPSLTASPSATDTLTAVPSPSSTETATASPSATDTLAASPSATVSVTLTWTASVSATTSPSVTETPSPTATESPSASPTASPSTTGSPSSTAGTSPTVTPSLTATETSSVTPKLTESATPTATPVFPQLVSLAPDLATTGSPVDVTVTGLNFVSGDQVIVSVGGLAQAPITPLSVAPTELVFTLPPQPVGTGAVSIVVDSPAGLASNAMTLTFKEPDTPVQASGPLKILGAYPVPNPNPHYLTVDLAGSADKVRVRVYTKSLFQVLAFDGGGLQAGWNPVPFPPASGNLPGGLYYIQIQAIRRGVVSAPASTKAFLVR